MNEMNENGFSFTYSAREQEEIKKIRSRYTKPEAREETKLERLKRLDRKVSEKAEIASLVSGILGALLLGFGMSLIMTDLGSFFAMSGTLSVAIGILVGVIGSLPMAFAYPIYRAVLKRERQKVADEILRLSDELMK